MKTITASELREKILKKELVRILDVRTQEEFKTGHLPGSLCIPVQDLPNYISVLSKSVPYIAVCKSGGRSNVAVAILDKEGFNVSGLIGGLDPLADLMIKDN